MTLSESHSMAKRLALAFAAAICAMALLLCCSLTLAASGGSIPSRAAKVAGGHGSHSSWGVWLFGARGQGCWGTRTRLNGELTGESATCGLSVPAHTFQLAATGVVSPRHPTQSLLFFLVRFPEVQSLKVRVQFPDQSTRWLLIAADGLTAASRSAARVPSNVGFAVRLVNGRAVCPRRVIAYDKANRPVGHGKLPPCGSS
jgi:hypothetical protein